ncbi:MAG: hypothetical protein KDC65_13460 [Saprospiraceae bacterium]|nr:hypothetical protein [Saprospiraceae bacterium]
MKHTTLLLLLLACCACANDRDSEAAEDQRIDLVRAVESAHKKAEFQSHQTVYFDVSLNWNGKPAMKATVLQRTDGTRIRVRKQNGSDILFDGQSHWLAPAGQDDPRARFDLFTWHYFFCLPWKLSDPGTQWQPLPDRFLEGRECRAGRLSFTPGTGDAPDDWYLVFSDKKQGLVSGAVYIVTYGGKDVEAAEKHPHAIIYSDYRPETGIPVAHTWTFYGWDTDSLDKKEALGTGEISNVRFSDEKPQDFAVPAGAVKI